MSIGSSSTMSASAAMRRERFGISVPERLQALLNGALRAGDVVLIDGEALRHSRIREQGFHRAHAAAEAAAETAEEAVEEVKKAAEEAAGTRRRRGRKQE